MASTESTSSSPRPGKVAITNVRVFNGRGLSELSTVYIDNGLIADRVEGAEVVDGQGGVLLPGLIDAHIHLQDENDLHALCQWGVTTGLDMATWPASKLAPLRGRVGLTDIRSAGLPATVAGSLHSCVMPFSQDELVVDDPAHAAAFVAKRVAEGSDYIKVIADVPGPSQAILNALVTAAHEHQKLVVAHAATITPFTMAQDAGADIITHSPRDQALDSEAAQRMVTDNQISVPTLVMSAGIMQPPSLWTLLRLLTQPLLVWSIYQVRSKAPKMGTPSYANARDSVTAMYRAGVPVLAGTDANSEPNSPFKVKHGESLHRELELLVDAGLSTVDALCAATSLPATHFGLRDRGTIEVGKRADLLLISDDPIRDIRATRSIQRVWCAGMEYQRS